VRYSAWSAIIIEPKNGVGGVRDILLRKDLLKLLHGYVIT